MAGKGFPVDCDGWEGVSRGLRWLKGGFWLACGGGQLVSAVMRWWAGSFNYCAIVGKGFDCRALVGWWSRVVSGGCGGVS